jgi:hypothetical protein
MTDIPRRRCLLLAGGVNPAYNYDRYGNELLWWGERLTGKGFVCRACIGDGQVGTHPTPAVQISPARRPDVTAALGWLTEVGEKDLGFLVVSNHGNTSGICLWGTDVLSPVELSQALGSAQGTLVLVMGQCHGGVFGTLAGPKRAVLSACRENEPSWACAQPPGLVYDEFLYQLGTALFGAPTDAPQPGPARRPLSLQSAFHWAHAQDRRNETPQLFDPAGIAASVVLG